MKQWAVAIAFVAALAVAFVNEAEAQKVFRASSSSSCTSSAVSRSDSSSRQVFIDLGVDLGHYVCEEQATDEVIRKTVSDTATAIAATVVSVSAKCAGGGWASAGGTAAASARTSAAAIASAFASVDACGNCTAAVQWFASASEEAVVNSTSYAVVEVDGDASEAIVQKTIREALIPVYIEILAQVQTGYGDGECNALVFGDFLLGDNIATCEAIARAWVEEVSLSGVADAAATAAAYACEEGPIAISTSEVVAFQTATAFAKAVADANVECQGSGEVDSCAMSRTAIATVVEAQAEAWATAWAESSGCSCKINAEETASSVAKIVVDAAADAYADACVDNEAVAMAQSYSESVAQMSVDAVAVAIATAITKGENCQATASAKACVGCTGTKWNRCAGFGIDGVLGCCDPKHVCMQRNAMTSVCVDADYKAPAGWDGRIRECD
eukprot:jgi/Ulvmu1/301/UM001_0305.1